MSLTGKENNTACVCTNERRGVGERTRMGERKERAGVSFRVYTEEVCVLAPWEITGHFRSTQKIKAPKK